MFYKPQQSGECEIIDDFIDRSIEAYSADELCLKIMTILNTIPETLECGLKDIWFP